MRLVKCQLCGKTDTPKEEMEYDLVGIKKKVKKYYHKECFQQYLKEKEFREQERKELDELVEVIKDIYGIKAVPNSAYPFLQDLRNGTKFFGKRDYKYKQGYKYSLIKDTFIYCADTIEYWNATKQFDGFMNAFKYGLAIVCDKLFIVEKKNKEKEMKKTILEKKQETYTKNNEDLSINKEVQINDKKDDMDISDLL